MNIRKILLNVLFPLSIICLLTSCQLELSSSYHIVGSSAIGFFNKTYSTYTYLSESEDIESLVKTGEGSVVYDGFTYSVTSQTQPLHPGDDIVILLRAPVKNSLHAYISLFGCSYPMPQKEDAKITANNIVIVSGNSYSYNSSSYSLVMYELEYRVPDVESGKSIVAICVSDDREEVYKWFGYITVEGK